MKTHIKNIANIQTGLFARPSDKGEVVYLQSKHFDENGQLLGALHPDLPTDEISERHLLKDGDVLFAAKGTKNFAAIYEKHNPAAVASTSFFVVRLIDKKVLTEYLAWFLNSLSTQTILKGQAKGTAIPSISKVMLEDLEITIPNIETQRAILQITKLYKKEKLLMQKIETLRDKLIQHQIINALK